MTMWTLVKALLVKDLIGFLISLSVCGLFALGCWLVVLYEERGDKKHPTAERRKK